MSINQYTMNNLLDNQVIQKRRTTRLDNWNAEREPARKPIKVKPPRKKIQKKGAEKAFRPAGIVSRFENNSRFSDGLVSPKKETESKKLKKPKSLKSPRHLPAFAFPAIPITALALLSLGIFSILYSQGTLDWIRRDAVTIKDEGSQYNLAVYAGVNSPAALPAEGTTAVTIGSISQEGSSIGSVTENLQWENNEIPLGMTETFAWQDYKVKRGDSVSKIAVDFNLSMDAIIASNGITNARSLREGEVLRIPNMDGIPYTVKSGDSLSQISQAMGVPLEAILDANDIQSDYINAGMTVFIPGARMNRDDLRLALGELFIYPVRGARLSSPFGWRNDPFTGVRRHHAALDLSAPQGTPVWAAMEGKVASVSFDRTFGNYVILNHSGGYQTMYAHLHSVSVKAGDGVAQGGQIGTVGSTGYSTGPHLHFALFRNGRAVNPLDYMAPQR